MSYSPYYSLPMISEELRISLSVKRDDLLPDFLGGNKVRKNRAIFENFGNKVDVIITNGGVESNHARVCALMAAQRGNKCHLVLHGTPEDSNFLNGNRFFIEASGAQVSYVAATEIAETIANIKSHYLNKGLGVEVVPGGGHSIEGAKAYMNAVNELPEEPDYIFLASGTGATHAGIQAGVVARGWRTKVVGISIARLNPRGAEAVEEVYYPLIQQEFGLTKEQCPAIEFVDDYVCGGYSKYSPVLIERIQKAICSTGLPLDPVYSGKAFVGMVDYLKKHQVQGGSRVVFWHTGGLLNLQSSKT
ncbi:pyridoxal-phosphate dependent enzyme [Pseudidiomarina sp. GXY010]|uniref:Pyridoxal-phosphate dependent enzyme n=1 Tax=Pseudidiomarina fusca TaxID=2965078 RepID=A0ABU3KZ11_9GAMM|nr:pyridoxal-phosphate dependent enzyme [Pseudidiomarina sp. GXY010]MDT7526325.1 pyridoxal-phosphate dependent enzyme [Pseudidiomarina sp. GXY010]